MTTRTTLAAGTTFGGWVIERPLSSGGMGAVYVAKHANTGRLVALKIIKADDVGASDELVSRFGKETNALAKISHPNVVTFLDNGVAADGTLFLVMELLSGKPLRDIMKAPIAPSRAMRIAADICRALAAVHQGNIIHRDLKPENVFLVDAVGHDEIAKLIDFGIVRLEEAAPGRATATKTGTVIGTPGYISPEQLQGRPATVASDVYAVGVILYELITGKFPFEAPSTHAMLVKQLIDPLPPPSSVVASLPPHVEALVLRFMEREPAHRVATATDALAQLVDAQAQLAAGGAAASPAAPSLPPSAATEMAVPAAAPAAAAAPPPRSAETRSGVSAAAATPQPSRDKTQQPTASTSSAAAAFLDEAAAPAPGGRRLLPLIGVGAASALVAGIVVVVAMGGDPDPAPAADAGAAAVAALKAADDAGAPATTTAALDPKRAAEEVDAAEGEADEPVRRAAGARFLGTYAGTFEGEAVVDGVATPERGRSKVRVAAAKGGRLTIQFIDAKGKSPCVTTLAPKGARAAFAPATQSCGIAVPGGRRTNRSSGALTLRDDGTLAFEVRGSFEFVPTKGPPAKGTFAHFWTLRRPE